MKMGKERNQKRQLIIIHQLQHFVLKCDFFCCIFTWNGKGYHTPERVQASRLMQGQLYVITAIYVNQIIVLVHSHVGVNNLPRVVTLVGSPTLTITLPCIFQCSLYERKTLLQSKFSLSRRHFTAQHRISGIFKCLLGCPQLLSVYSSQFLGRIYMQTRLDGLRE